MLIQNSDGTEDLRRALYEDYDLCEGHLSVTQQSGDLGCGLHSPFTLNIPELQSRHRSPEATHPDEQQLGGPDEEPEQSTPNVRVNATSIIVKIAQKPMKTSRDGFPYHSFPSQLSKRIASTFARSLGRTSTIIDKETLVAITEATDQYFEQLSSDLGVFANHAGRRKIDESDVIAVMMR